MNRLSRFVLFATCLVILRASDSGDELNDDIVREMDEFLAEFLKNPENRPARKGFDKTDHYDSQTNFIGEKPKNFNKLVRRPNPFRKFLSPTKEKIYSEDQSKEQEKSDAQSISSMSTMETVNDISNFSQDDDCEDFDLLQALQTENDRSSAQSEFMENQESDMQSRSQQTKELGKDITQPQFAFKPTQCDGDLNCGGSVKRACRKKITKPTTEMTKIAVRNDNRFNMQNMGSKRRVSQNKLPTKERVSKNKGSKIEDEQAGLNLCLICGVCIGLSLILFAFIASCAVSRSRNVKKRAVDQIVVIASPEKVAV